MADTGCRAKTISGKLSVLEIGRLVKHLVLPKWNGVVSTQDKVVEQFTVRAETETDAKAVGYRAAHEQGIPPEGVHVQVWVIDETRA